MAKQTLQGEILLILHERGALNRRDLAQHCSGERSVDSVSIALNSLKHAGLVERANNECWRLTDAGRTEARMAAKHGATAPSEPSKLTVKEPLTVDPPPRLQDDIEPTARPTHAQAIERQGKPHAITALQRAAQHAQDALDAYVWEVGDAAVLEPLMAARDAASQALAAYEARA